MALLFDFFPVLLFFLAYQWKGIFFATAVIIVATLAQVAIQWLRTRSVKPIHLVTAILVFLFGGLTLLLRDAALIKWKVSVLYWLLATGFFAVPLLGERRTVIERLLGDEIRLPDFVWRRLNAMWIGFFLFLGATNLYVMFNFDTDTWVDFKFFGVLGLTVLFVLVQAIYLSRHIVEDDVQQDK